MLLQSPTGWPCRPNGDMRGLRRVQRSREGSPSSSPAAPSPGGPRLPPCKSNSVVRCDGSGPLRRCITRAVPAGRRARRTCHVYSGAQRRYRCVTYRFRKAPMVADFVAPILGQKSKKQAGKRQARPLVPQGDLMCNTARQGALFLKGRCATSTFELILNTNWYKALDLDINM